MKLFNLFFIFLLVAEAAHGATLAELRQAALSNRQIVERYKMNLEKTTNSLDIARSAYYPSVDISHTMNSLRHESYIEQRENSVSYGAIRWNIFSGFRDRYAVRSALLMKKAEAYKLQAIEQDIQLNVSLHYLSLYSSKSNFQVAKDYRASLEKMYKDSENRYKVGLIRKNDLLKVKVDLDNAVIDMKRAEAAVRKNGTLLGREINGQVDIDQLTFGEFDQLPSVEIHDTIEAAMLEKRSEVRILNEMIEASKAQQLVEKASYSPKVDLVGSYRKYEDDFLPGNGSQSLGGINDEEVRAQLVFSMNLFDGFAKSAKLSQAKKETYGLHNDLEELKNDLKTQLTNLFFDYEVSYANADVALSGIKQAEENYRVTELSFQEGLVTQTDLLDATASLSRARSNYLTAKSDVFANYYKILRAADGL